MKTKMKAQSPSELNCGQQLMVLQTEFNEKLQSSPYINETYVTKANLRSMVNRGCSKADLESYIFDRLARVVGYLHGDDAKREMHFTVEVELKSNRVMIIAEDWAHGPTYMELRQRDAEDEARRASGQPLVRPTVPTFRPQPVV